MELRSHLGCWRCPWKCTESKRNDKRSKRKKATINITTNIVLVYDQQCVGVSPTGDDQFGVHEPQLSPSSHGRNPRASVVSVVVNRQALSHSEITTLFHKLLRHNPQLLGRNLVPRMSHNVVPKVRQYVQMCITKYETPQSASTSPSLSQQLQPSFVSPQQLCFAVVDVAIVAVSDVIQQCGPTKEGK